MKHKDDFAALESRFYTIVILLSAFTLGGFGLWRGSQQQVHSVGFDEFMISRCGYQIDHRTGPGEKGLEQLREEATAELLSLTTSCCAHRGVKKLLASVRLPLTGSPEVCEVWTVPPNTATKVAVTRAIQAHRMDHLTQRFRSSKNCCETQLYLYLEPN